MATFKPPLNVYTGPVNVPVLRARVALEFRQLPKHDKVWGASCWHMPDGTGRVVTLWGKRFAAWRETIHVCADYADATAKYHSLINSKYQYGPMSPDLRDKMHAQLEAYGNTLMTLEATKTAQTDADDCTLCITPGSPGALLVKQAHMFCIDCWVPLAEHSIVHPHTLKLTECQGFVRAEPGQTIKRPEPPFPLTQCSDCSRMLSKHTDEQGVLAHDWRRVCSLCKRVSTKYALVHSFDCPFGKAIRVSAPQIVAVKQLTDSNRPARDISGFADDF